MKMLIKIVKGGADGKKTKTVSWYVPLSIPSFIDFLPYLYLDSKSALEEGSTQAVEEEFSMIHVTIIMIQIKILNLLILIKLLFPTKIRQQNISISCPKHKKQELNKVHLLEIISRILETVFLKKLVIFKRTTGVLL